MPNGLIKDALSATVREVHRFAALRPLPNRVSIYFHELEEAQWPAFAEAIAYFKTRGYRSVPIGEYTASESDENLLLVTFDDNYRCWWRALSLLDELDVTATFFINTAPIRGEASREVIETYFDRIGFDGERETLSRDEIRTIRSAGHVIGAHSHSHPDLTTLEPSQWAGELLWSKQILEETIGEEVVDFSYPFGMRRYFNEGLRSFCLAHGYKTIAAGIPGRLHQAPIERANLQRTRWQFTRNHEQNIEDVQIDGRLFEDFTGRSAVG